MRYINPYELLKINSANLSDIDSKTVLKEKRKLLHEIELSDTDTINHNGIDLTKSDCLKAVDDLDDRNKKEFHFFIFQNNHLNDFLSKGSLLFFEKYQVESIYKLPEFLDFISPYFAPQYDKILTANFNKRNINDVSKILSVKPITNELFLESCYKSTYSTIKNLDNGIKEIIKDVELNKSAFINNNFIGLDSLIKERIHVDVINVLPAYFQSLRNQLAQSIRNLARDINNDPYNLYEPAYRIIEIANSLSTDGLVRQTITKGYYTIKKNYEDNLSKQSQLSEISKSVSHKSVIDEEEPTIIQEPAKEESKDKSASKVFAGFLVAVSGLFVWAFFNSTVQKVILSLATLFYIGWIYNNIKKKPESSTLQAKAQALIYFSSFVVCIGGFFYPILSILFVSYFLIVFLHLFYASLASKKSPGALAGFVYLILAIAITALWYYYNQPNNETIPQKAEQESTTPVSNGYSSSLTDTEAAASIPNTNSTSQSYSTVIEPAYTKVSMKNGNISDCSGIVPKYDNTLKTKLIISAELTDVAVKIFDYRTDKCIRFVFINDGTTYTVKSIPEGKYYLKIAYGNDWSVKEGESMCKGHFASHASFKKDYEVYDLNLKRYGNGDISTPYYTLKLYRTHTLGNTDNGLISNSISEADFNNN